MCFHSLPKRRRAISNNPKLCVTLSRQNAHLLRVNCTVTAIASLDFCIIRCHRKKNVINDFKLVTVLIMDIAQNLHHLKSSLPAHVALVAVSKFHSVSELQQAYDAGQKIFGENRVQELVAKYPLLPSDIQWHFIGTLQTNKVKYIIPFIDTIQSVDSLRLLTEIEKQVTQLNRRIRVLLEVHIAEETTKHGFEPDECLHLFVENKLDVYPHVVVAGLMGMATFTDDTKQVDREFKRLKGLFDEIKRSGRASDSFTELSMGMSDDYPIAIRNGSTMIRVGTMLFGERNR